MNTDWITCPDCIEIEGSIQPCATHRTMDTLDNHIHRFAAIWERSRIAGTMTRLCTFPDCRIVTLDGSDDNGEITP